MARSNTSIANRAIDILGGLTITSLNDNKKSARALKRAYDPVLRDLLSKTAPSFAIKRVELAVNSTDPVYGFDTSFDLPIDFIRLLEVYPKYLRHKKEGNAILADANELKIKYVYHVTNENYFSDEFAELFALALAQSTCYKITQSRVKESDLKRDLKEAIRWFMSNDSKGAGTAEAFATDVWMAHRGYASDPEQNAQVLDDFDYGSVS